MLYYKLPEAVTSFVTTCSSAIPGPGGTNVAVTQSTALTPSLTVTTVELKLTIAVAGGKIIIGLGFTTA